MVYCLFASSIVCFFCYLLCLFIFIILFYLLFLFICLFIIYFPHFLRFFDCFYFSLVWSFVCCISLRFSVCLHMFTQLHLFVWFFVCLFGLLLAYLSAGSIYIIVSIHCECDALNVRCLFNKNKSFIRAAAIVWYNRLGEQPFRQVVKKYCETE